jgi:hypothetical protein
MVLGRDDFKPTADPRHRILPQAEMIEILLLAGWAFEVEAGDRAKAEAAVTVALERWIAQGLGVRRGADAGLLFDPVEVVNFAKHAGLTGRDRFWEERYVKTGRALVDGLAQAMAAGGRVGMTIARVFDARAFAEGAMLRLRLPIPLSGPDIRDLDITPTIGPDLGAQVTLRAHHLEARCARPADGDIVLSARFEFTLQAQDAPGRERALSPEARAIYLGADEGLIQLTPRVEALAAALAGTARHDRDAVAALWNHMLDNLICGAVRYGDLQGHTPVDWVLDHGWYDCQLGSALLVALCRARGIPARLVGGYMLYPLAPTNHFWSEIWLEGEGWRPYDLLAWDLSAGGRDAEWREVFSGQVDPRLVTQRLPLAFTGSMSRRFPAAWQMAQTRVEGGIAVTYRDVEDGALIFRELISVDLHAAPQKLALQT